MAVTNAQISEQLNALNADMLQLEENLAAKLSFVSNKDLAQEVLGQTKTYIREFMYRVDGDRTEVIRLLDSVNSRLANLEYHVATHPAEKRKTWREKWDELMVSVMGTNPAKR